jgi:L-alanine-DL-glutamate epimerase-like enolase superfamily enzyme
LSVIAAVNTHPIVVPLKRGHRTAHEPRADVSLLLVEVRTDDGITGYGQVTSTPMKEIAEWVARLAETAIGMDARAPVAVWEALFALTSPRVGVGGLPRAARPQIMAAIGGIDMALWDLLGKSAGLPVFRLLGAENRPVFAYATGGYYVDGEKLTACADELGGFVHRRGQPPRRSIPHRCHAEGHRRRHPADARHERRLRLARLHRVRARG